MANRKTKLAAAIAATLSLLALAACTPDIREVPAVQSGAQSGPQSGEAVEEATEPVLDEDRIRRIVREVQEVLDRAEEEADPEILAERLTAGALHMRQGQFVRAARTGTDIPPLQIEVNVASATASNTWPRVLLVGSSAGEDDPAEVFIFTQEDAKAPYMLENWVRVLGGHSVRGVAVEDGSTPLGPDDQGFEVTPAEALETYVAFLNDPAAEENQIFEDNLVAPHRSEEIAALNSAALAEAGGVSSSATVGDYPITGVELATGEALVAASFTYTDVFARTVAGATMSMGGTPAAYLDDPNVVGTVSVHYLVNVFYTIPAKGTNEPVRIVGAERVITSVSRDDGAVPEGE